MLVTQILFNFALMEIDDLFINNNKTASEELKISEDSLVEPLAQSADELKSAQYDTLMSIYIPQPFSDSSNNLDEYLIQKAKSFKQLILPNLNGIGKCSRIYVGYDCFGEIKLAGSSKYVAFAFKREFTSVREILKLINVTWSYFSLDSYCNFRFLISSDGNYYNSDDIIDYYYDFKLRKLYLNYKKKETHYYISGNFLKRLTYITYSLLPNGIGIKPYEQLCDFYGTNLFETDIVSLFLASKQMKDACLLIKCKINEGYLKGFDRKISINSLCPENASDVMLFTMSPKHENVSTATLIPDITIKTAIEIGYFMGMMKNELTTELYMHFDGIMPFVMSDSVTIRQFSIYSNLTTGPIKFILIFRLDPIYVDGRPTEVVFTKEIKIDIPYHGSYGTMVAGELSNMLQLRFPDSFINEFDKQFDIISEQQLKEQIKFHGREH